MTRGDSRRGLIQGAPGSMSFLFTGMGRDGCAMWYNILVTHEKKEKGNWDEVWCLEFQKERPTEEGEEYFQGVSDARKLTITSWTNTVPESRPGSSTQACLLFQWELYAHSPSCGAYTGKFCLLFCGQLLLLSQDLRSGLLGEEWRPGQSSDI